MSSKKKLRSAVSKFHKENPQLHDACTRLLSNMSKLIMKTGVAEVVVGINNGMYYERTEA